MKFWVVEGGFAWRNQTPPPIAAKKLNGPMSWPFLGFLPEMGCHAHRKLASTAASMGLSRLMAFSLGTTRMIISSHPDTAKEILCGSSFSDRPVKESAKLLMFERAIGFAPSGSYWRHLRRMAANHMFSPRRIAGLEGVRQAIAGDMIGKMEKEMSESGFVEVRGVVGEGSLRNVVESVFGSSLELENEGEELGLMVKEGYELIGEFNWGDYFPAALGFMDLGGRKRKCQRLAGRVNDVVGRIIEKRKREEEVKLKKNNDFLSVLLSLPKQDQLADADLVAVLWVSSPLFFLPLIIFILFLLLFPLNPY